MSGPELCGSPKISGHFYAAGRACPAPTVLPYKKREQKSPFTLFWHSCGLAIQVFLVLEGVPGILDIIIVVQGVQQLAHLDELIGVCLLYTSDAADEEDSVDLGGRRVIKKKKKVKCNACLL